jgi:sigma-B regulation protein RsbU (phosphoserine phosphatase)
MRLYYADDSEDARDIVAGTLARGGYEDFHFAVSGVDILGQLGIDPPEPDAPKADLILLDIRMPGIDGVETCARLRGDARYRHIPILMVTSLDDMDTLNHAFVAGANDYINKPFNPVELLARIRAALRLKSELDRRRTREQELLAALESRGLRQQKAREGGLDPATALLTRDIIENYAATASRGDFGRLGGFALQIDRLAEFQRLYGPVAERDLLLRLASVIARLPASLGDLLSHFDLGLFAALLRDTGREDLAAMAEAARRAVRDLAIPHRGADAPGIVTVSIGIAHGLEARALLSAAIGAAERAGGEGGNRIVLA